MISLVTHRLTEAGVDAWPEWMRRMRALLARAPGFVSVEAFEDPGDAAVRVVLLEMRSEDDLATWRSSASKDVLLRELATFSQRPFEARRLSRA